MMSFIWTIIIGFIVGALAKLFNPGKDNLGFIITTLLGVGGSVAAAIIGRGLGWYQPNQPAGFIASVITATAILFIYTRMTKK